MTDYFGAHMSIAGGIPNAVDRGVESGCGVIQVFTQTSNMWRGKTPTDSDCMLFRQKRADAGIRDVISHDIYLINLASPEGDTREKSLRGFREEMERCARLGIDKIVMHPGSHLGEGEEVGIRRIADAFDLLLSQVPEFSGTILLELTAGQGSNIGSSFGSLRGIIDACAYPDRLGVCYDTCHTFAAGYDIRTPEGYAAVFEEFDRVLGLERLLAFHLNDSKKGLDSRIDRHEHIGQGCLGIEAFRHIVNDPRFSHIPKILETPKDDDMDRVNLAILRDLVGTEALP